MYTEKGYLDWQHIDDMGAVYNVVIGGRGIGKTYGCLQHLTRCRRFFLFLRRTQSQIDIISNPMFNPLKPVFNDLDLEYEIKPVSKTKTTAAYHDDRILCINAALSTFANLRGWSGDGITDIVYDEFIPSPGERPIKDEGEAFLHCYETINRNRELEGKNPVRVFLLANAFDITADILRVLGLTTEIEKMQRKQIPEKIIYRNGVKIGLWLPVSEISEKKSETALYRVADDRFKRVSLKNSDGTLTEVIGYKPLQEYTLHTSTDDFAVYKHKSKREYYVTGLMQKSKDHYQDNPRERAKFKLKYNPLYLRYLSGRVYFDNRLRERLFLIWMTGK